MNYMNKKAYLANYYQNNQTKKDILQMYRKQLRKFKDIGVGNRTEFGAIVTETLIDVTRKRLVQLEQKLVADKYNGCDIAVKAVA